MFDAVTFIGLAASVLVTLSYIPEVWKTVKSKHTRDLSLSWIVSLPIGQILFLIYGIEIVSIILGDSGGVRHRDDGNNARLQAEVQEQVGAAPSAINISQNRAILGTSMKQTPTLPMIRNRLERSAVGIVLAFSERAEHPTNPNIYLRKENGGVPLKFSDGDFSTAFRRGREIFDAGFGRFKDNRQHPFFPESANAPLMVVRNFDEQVPRTVNKNKEIARAYFNILRRLCVRGDDGEYGETASADLDCLQRLSFRIHYGEIVAERKFLDHPEIFRPLMVGKETGREWRRPLGTASGRPASWRW